jgi:hypothetical protein
MNKASRPSPNTVRQVPGPTARPKSPEGEESRRGKRKDPFVSVTEILAGLSWFG